MGAFLARRLGAQLVLTALAASLAYLLAAVALDPRANYAGRSPRPPDAVIDAQLSAVNLNDEDPLGVRYLTWVSGLGRGDFGRSWDGAPIGPTLLAEALVSLRLVVCGLVLGAVAGIAAGAYAAVRPRGWFDRVTTGGSFVVLAVPTVVLANVLILAAVRVNDLLGWKVLLVSGETTPGDGSPLDRARHLALPTLTLGLTLAAFFSRYQRAAMLDALHADHVRTARAKGLTRRAALVRHALRTALVPVATYFAFTFGALLVGATITESVFGWYGLGNELVTSIRAGDVNTVAAISLLAAVAILLASLAADLLHALLDPRVRTP